MSKKATTFSCVVLSVMTQGPLRAEHLEAPEASIDLTSDSFTQPSSISDLLNNLHIAWDKRLLPQHWSRTTLQRAFAASKITHNPRIAQLDADWSVDKALKNRNGHLAVYTPFLTAPIEFDQSHYHAAKETSPRVYRYSQHDEGSGSVTFELRDAQNVRWADVKQLFGYDAVVAPLPLNVSAATPTGQGLKPASYQVNSWENEISLMACYRSPTSLPQSIVVEWEYDEACFFLKRASTTNTPQHTDQVLIDIEDEDIVRHIRINQHLGHIFGFCYRLRVDPTLAHFCPPRSGHWGHRNGRADARAIR